MCTSPVYISRSSLNSAAARLATGRKPTPGASLYEQSKKGICVPCGKCDECLKKRQNDIMLRCYRTALGARSAFFITFTYSEDNLPIAASLWCTDKATGETQCVTPPEIVQRYIDPKAHNKEIDPKYETYRAGVVQSSLRPRVAEFPAFRDESGESLFADKEYFVVCVPSVNSRDMRLCIKRWRVRCQRSDTLGALPEDMSYMLVSEYGHKRTMRPHYHMFLFNVTEAQADALANEWLYGDVQVKQVNKVNADGSNGYQNVARYIGKYSAKGKYDPSIRVQAYVVKHRIAASRHFGTFAFSEHDRDWFLARDIVDYDPDSIDSCLALTEDQKVQICETIHRRMKFTVPILIRSKDPIDYGQVKRVDVDYSMPMSFRKVLFKKKRILDHEICSPISLIYSNYVRDMVSENDSREFKEFVSHSGTEDFSLACAQFDYGRQVALQTRAAACSESHKTFYLQSKF